ncbi:MAG TPA: sugar ABC transporter ATP-binding protein [Spirochaetia bacterium]|nr:sugar ABC transporter ATP-binding protein [Spirochaetia bacterium]
MSDLLVVENLRKSFPGVLAVADVSFSLRKGEILALIGENGAGKSTLSQILGGAVRPDSGKIILEGREVSFATPQEAIHGGIRMMFQELSLVGSLSIAENIFANRQPVGALNGIRWKQLYRETAEFLQRFHVSLNPRSLVKRLVKGEQQILEFLKAISTSPRVLILDEPTSSLTETESAYLMDNIRTLRAEGMSFIYITHKLSEVFRISDRVIVMRDGRHVGSRPTSQCTERDLVAMMVGRDIADNSTRPAAKTDGECLRIENFSRRGAFSGISFTVHKGEILGLSGLVGSGRTELARAVFGMDPHDGGRVFLEGRPVRSDSPHEAIRAGIAYLTEDRKELGLYVNMPIRDNLIAPTLRRFTSAFGFMQNKPINDFAAAKIREFSIASPSSFKKVGKLSGGNQQKCLVATWVGTDPKAIFLDEPTRGVDVASRADIYMKIEELASAGIGIILISSDLPELIGLCDRILVMHHGRIVGEVERKDFSEELILSYATGLQSDRGEEQRRHG